eukprot:363419-Chlamydomonas_euryale.AAC.9
MQQRMFKRPRHVRMRCAELPSNASARHTFLWVHVTRPCGVCAAGAQLEACARRRAAQGP